MHPLVDMLGMGARVTINTDDPSVSDTTLTDEYLVVTLAMGVTAVQLKTMILTAAEASFQSDRARRILVERLRQELAQFPEL